MMPARSDGVSAEVGAAAASAETAPQARARIGAAASSADSVGCTASPSLGTLTSPCVMPEGAGTQVSHTYTTARLQVLLTKGHH